MIVKLPYGDRTAALIARLSLDTWISDIIDESGHEYDADDGQVPFIAAISNSGTLMVGILPYNKLSRHVALVIGKALRGSEFNRDKTFRKPNVIDRQYAAWGFREIVKNPNFGQRWLSTVDLSNA